jgi:hypothetical protein
MSGEPATIAHVGLAPEVLDSGCRGFAGSFG